MMGSMNLGSPGAGGDGGDMEFMPMMQHMMKSLISKDVLYPSLKEISDKVWQKYNTALIRHFFYTANSCPIS
jgi:hypothetical protein